MPAGPETLAPVAVRPVCKTRMLLGEGVCWHEGSVYWVDIEAAQLRAWSPLQRVARMRVWSLPQRIGWVVPRAGGGWLAGLQAGVALLQLGSAREPRLQWLHMLHEPDSPMRLNDAKVDRRGRLWLGTMHMHRHDTAQGRLWRLDTDLSLHLVDDAYHIPNGPAFSPDGRTMYHTDSALGVVYAYPLDSEGQPGRRRVWWQAGPGEGSPDGMTCDASGRVWIAHWGGACVSCHAPDDAAMLLRLPVPALQPSNVCFGGPHLRDLYISSARIGLDGAMLRAWPGSGALLCAPEVAQGLAQESFRG
ncbi:MAG: SMP-30/gluconolactonase/LRE family protein [Halothiobacillaceae bacterium]